MLSEVEPNNKESLMSDIQSPYVVFPRFTFSNDHQQYINKHPILFDSNHWLNRFLVRKFPKYFSGSIALAFVTAYIFIMSFDKVYELVIELLPFSSPKYLLGSIEFAFCIAIAFHYHLIGYLRCRFATRIQNNILNDILSDREKRNNLAVQVRDWLKDLDRKYYSCKGNEYYMCFRSKIEKLALGLVSEEDETLDTRYSLSMLFPDCLDKYSLNGHIVILNDMSAGRHHMETKFKERERVLHESEIILNSINEIRI